jgi:hydrogenase nickel incorporation protein HypA/HybF
MHEFSIATSLLEIITHEALPYPGARVKKVTLRIGALSGVLPHALRFSFEILSEGTVAEGATLVIEEIPLTLSCKNCGRTSSPEDPFLICPFCESTEVALTGGRELEILNMEIENGNQGHYSRP